MPKFCLTLSYNLIITGGNLSIIITYVGVLLSRGTVTAMVARTISFQSLHSVAAPEIFQGMGRKNFQAWMSAVMTTPPIKTRRGEMDGRVRQTGHEMPWRSWPIPHSIPHYVAPTFIRRTNQSPDWASSYYIQTGIKSTGKAETNGTRNWNHNREASDRRKKIPVPQATKHNAFLPRKEGQTRRQRPWKVGAAERIMWSPKQNT